MNERRRKLSWRILAAATIVALGAGLAMDATATWWGRHPAPLAFLYVTLGSMVVAAAALVYLVLHFIVRQYRRMSARG